MMMFRTLLFLTFHLLAATHSHASPQQNGFKTNLNLNGINLELKAVETHKVSLFSFHIYQVAFYSSDTSKGLRPRVVLLKFLRPWNVQKLNNTWFSAFDAQGNHELYFQRRLGSLSRMMESLEVGDSLQFNFFSNSVEVLVKEKFKGRIEGEKFQQALFQFLSQK